MYIIHIIRKFSKKQWGGAEQVILNLCQKLSRPGKDYVVFTLKAFSIKPRDYIDGVAVRRFSGFYPYIGLSKTNKRALDQKGGGAISISLLFDLLFSRDIQLVHFHSVGPLLISMSLVCCLRKIPFLVTIHYPYELDPDGSRIQIENLTRTGLNLLKPFKKYLNTDKVLRMANAITFVDKAAYKRYANTCSSQRVYWVPNGIEISRHPVGDSLAFREKYGIKEDYILGFVGRIDPQKNQKSLISAFKEILKKYPSTMLVLIGHSSVSDYYQEVIALIKELELEGNVLLIPDLEPGSVDLANAYSACDVFVIPSLWEGFPVVLLEAWAAKKPVVAANVGGIPYIVANGKDGYLFDNESEMIELVCGLLVNKELGCWIGENGYEKVSSEYTWDIVARKFEEIYDEITKR